MSATGVIAFIVVFSSAVGGWLSVAPSPAPDGSCRCGRARVVHEKGPATVPGGGLAKLKIFGGGLAAAFKQGLPGALSQFDRHQRKLFGCHFRQHFFRGDLGGPAVVLPLVDNARQRM